MRLHNNAAYYEVIQYDVNEPIKMPSRIIYQLFYEKAFIYSDVPKYENKINNLILLNI